MAVRKIKTPTYSGENRRMDEDQHDKVCDRRLNWIKTLLVAVIGSIVLGGGFGYTQNEDMKQTNAIQGENINHNRQELDKLDEKFDRHINEQKAVNKEMLYILNQLKTDMVVIKREVGN